MNQESLLQHLQDGSNHFATPVTATENERANRILIAVEVLKRLIKANQIDTIPCPRGSNVEIKFVNIDGELIELKVIINGREYPYTLDLNEIEETTPDPEEKK